MSYPINTSIPAASHTPAADQPEMQTNFNNISQYLAVDHVLAGAANNGQHKQVNFPSNNIPLITPVALKSVVYTNTAGSGNVSTASGKSQLFYVNSNGTIDSGTPTNNVVFPISLIAAYAIFSGNGSVSIISGNNYGTVGRTSAGVYTVALPSNVVANSNFAVIVSCSGTNAVPTTPLSCGYNITGSGQFTIYTGIAQGANRDANSVSFVVLQL